MAGGVGGTGSGGTVQDIVLQVPCATPLNTVIHVLSTLQQHAVAVHVSSFESTPVQDVCTSSASRVVACTSLRATEGSCWVQLIIIGVRPIISAGCAPLLQLEAACATPPAADYISFDFGRLQQPAAAPNALQQPAAAPNALQQQAQHPGPVEKAPETLRQGQAKATGVKPAVKAAQLQEQGQARPAGEDSRKRKALPEEHREPAKQQKVAAPQPTLPVVQSSWPASKGGPAAQRQGGEAGAAPQQQYQTPSLRPGATIFRPHSHGPASAAAPGQIVAAGPSAPQAAAAAAPASSGEGRASTSSAGAAGVAPFAAKPAAPAPANPPAATKPAAGGRPPGAAAAAAAQPGAVCLAEGPTQQRVLERQLKAAAPVQPERPAAQAAPSLSTAPAPEVSSPLPAGRPPSTAPEQQPAPNPPSPARRMGLQLPPDSSPPVGWPHQQSAGLAPGFVPSPQQRRMFGSPTAPRSNGGLPASPQSLPFRLGQQLQAVPQPNAFSFHHGLAAVKPAGPTTLRPRVPGPQPPPLTRLQQSAGQKRKASGQEARSGAPMASTSHGTALRSLGTAAADMGQLGRPSPGSPARLPASNGRGQAHSAKPASHDAAATNQAAAGKQSTTAAAVKQPAAAAVRSPEAPPEPSNDFARSAIVAELRSFDAVFTTTMKDDSYLTKALRKGPFIRQSWKRVRSWHGSSCPVLVALSLKCPSFITLEACSFPLAWKHQSC